MITVENKRVYMSGELDAEVWDCLKESKTRLNVLWEAPVHGEWVRLSDDRIANTRFVATLFPSSVCDRKPLPETVRARIDAPNSIGAARFSSAPVAVNALCDPCASMSAGGVTVVREEGKYLEITGTVESDWRACADMRPNANQARLQLRFFLGATSQDVQAATRPTLVLAVDAHVRPLRQRLPYARFCEDRSLRFLGVEMAGSGAYREANGSGRSIIHLSCR